ncbi:MAG: Phosphoesterase RecJ domain protein [Candidatus Uhrbacteria bacterium GW2011_GWF2_41_16]|uniref:Phosphoesterase RecJ domain protein n=2 Tax=Candidatus Uhriibacteriota TaxID=1752732 RepID=A0A0G0VFC0_9BACT|nr:MAG: Phosphoesterase RecJ domain protein [Candidatus Uhrbacteria bacterium GW2011_GWC2_41_11]KKR98351.1 MAG: Phosphoesterase RecJ domain protein [Candidatus Uhrbacteria bacterium GW2011_GWF2_41_16]HBP00075.1 hypothetical protein [Candidatus Uhrbacteria bacterium]
MPTFSRQRIFHRLNEAQNIIFIPDKRIDGDSIGAVLALADYFKRLKKNVCIFVSESLPEKYQFLPGASVCISDFSLIEKEMFDLAVSCDCSDAVYVTDIIHRFPRPPFLINIDHHKTNSYYGDMNLVEEEASAACEVVYRLFRTNQIIPSREAATCLLCGIAFDTTIFSNDGTNARALEAASELVLYGARTQDVIRMIFRNRSIAALRIWGLALERLRTHEGLSFVSTCLTRKDMEENGVTDDEVDGLSDFLNVVVNVQTLFVLRETKDGGIKVSMRTTDRNVANLARMFGGGGHIKAAGFTIPHMQLISHSLTGIWCVVERDRTC